jgi:predicted nucleic acid-binding Zn finger protein
MDQFCTITNEFYNTYKYFMRNSLDLIIHIRFIQASLMFTNSLKMIKIDRNMSDLRQIVCKKYNYNISVFVGFIL